jgi:membrane-associated phospholipid phosphatase
VNQRSKNAFDWTALRTSLWLAALFLFVYGGSNLLAARHAGVGSYYFAWERHIPFVPLMLLPYMSIDLFFLAAPFVCDARGRAVLARRVVAAILVSGAFFLLMPLRFAFDRPAVSGWLGALFGGFRHLDRPFNQFPSLHIALLIILAGVYGRCTRGAVRGFLAVWFVLIGLSTVLTYQHHVIDVFGGAALGVLCVYFFPMNAAPPRAGGMLNARVGAYYAVGAAMLSVAAVAWRPGGWLLLWPALSLAVLAAGYFGAGSWIYRKSGGRLSPGARIMLWPALLGQRLSLIYYRRRSGAWDAMTDRLWIGRLLSGAEATAAVKAGVSTVVDLTGEFSEARAFRAAAYHSLPILDLTAPSMELLDEAVRVIGRGVRRGIVYVHCKAGYSRTAAVVGAYLLASGAAVSAEQAMAMVRAARRGMVIRPEAAQAIWEYEARLGGDTVSACRETGDAACSSMRWWLGCSPARWRPGR